MRKRFLLLVVIFIVIMLAGTLVSCNYLQNLLNGNPTDNTKEGDAPVIIGLETIKAADGYLSSTEYIYNSQGTNPMALTFSEKYYVVIHYKNDYGFTISSVKLTWKDGKGQSTTQSFSQNTFADGSNNEVTYLEFQTPDESAFQSNSTITFTINKVFYVNGSQTIPVGWSEEVENKFITVALRPTFTLNLDYMNADLRRGKETAKETKKYERVYYKTELKSYISSTDYTGKSSVPTKKGGWVFAGWYTEPQGQGNLVTADDLYDYWCDMTLYAYYERMYDIELEEMETPITHSYRETGTGAARTIEFTSGAVLKNRGKNSSDSVCSNYLLEIPDTVVIEKVSVSQKQRNDKMPKFDVSVTATEYPVIRLAPNVFTNYNTIEIAELGKYVKEIGYAAFQGCTKMETLSIGDGSILQYIGDYAFEKTDALGQSYPFTLPSTVEYLGMCAFRESGWGLTKNPDSGAAGESRLIIPATWKYIGYKCFSKTRFQRIVFSAGCHFDSQITSTEGKRDESATGSKTIRQKQNRIGASIFERCYRISNVVFECEDGKENGLNIIPDLCFDAGSWFEDTDKRDGTFSCISFISFGEGLKYVGERAFNYQVKIPELSLPITLEEVDKNAFYNCTSVTNLNFEHVDQKVIDKEGIKKALTNNSQLRILHSAAFCNLTGIDVVYITSAQFALYGNGVFRGCSRLKCIIFNNIQSVSQIPTGYKSGDAGINTENGPKYSTARGDVIDNDEVLPAHEMADFLYGTAEDGEKENSQVEFALTYTSPVRIFCATEYVDILKRDMIVGKNVYADLKRLKASSGTKSYNSSVFIHSLDNLLEYKYKDGSEEQIVSIAVQEIYKASGGKPTTTILGYSLVYWGARSKNIVLPTVEDLDNFGGGVYEIIELAAYALPTSVQTLYVPKCYRRFEHDALNGCSGLYRVTYEDVNTLEYIGQYAFFGTAIRSFTGGSALKVIGNYAFNRCENLVWVDLGNTPILNKYNGRMTFYYQYKYEYELDDYDEDFSDCIGNSAFQGCSALQWIHLPENIMQLQEGTFIRCHSLKTVIIPTAKPSTSTSATDDDCFYAYGQSSLIFDPAYLHQMSFYVASTATEIHQTLLDSRFLYGGRYQLLESAPEHPNVQ